METTKNNSLIQNKYERWRMIALILSVFSVETIFRYVIIVINKLPVVSALSGMFLPALFFPLIVLNYNSWIRYRVKNADILFVLIFYLTALLSYLIFPESREGVEKQYMTILATFPLHYFFGIIYTADKTTEEMLAFLGKIIIVIDIIFTIYWQNAGNELGEDAMSRAYRMTPSVMFLIMNAFNRGKKIDWVWMIFSAIYLFSCGTRGPIVIIAIFIMYFMLFKEGRTKRTKQNSLLIFIGVVIFYNTPAFESLLEFISELFSNLGFSTRVFDHMQEETLISDNTGRDKIYSVVYEVIAENPLGAGILIEGSKMVNGSKLLVHNFYLQLILHFGILFGPLILVSLITIIARALRITNNVCAKDMIVMWGLFVFIRGFVGGSYLSYYFPFLLGLCISELRKNN